MITSVTQKTNNLQKGTIILNIRNSNYNSQIQICNHVSLSTHLKYDDIHLLHVPSQSHSSPLLSIADLHPAIFKQAQSFLFVDEQTAGCLSLFCI